MMQLLPAASSASASASVLLQSAPGEMPRVALERLQVSTAGRSRRVKIDASSGGDAATDVAAAKAGSPADAAASKVSDIFAPAAAAATPAAVAAAPGARPAAAAVPTLDDVFGGAAPTQQQKQAQKDVLDTLFG
jgi:hypothetical protein